MTCKMDYTIVKLTIKMSHTRKMCYLFHLDTEQNYCQNFYRKIFLVQPNLYYTNSPIAEEKDQIYKCNFTA